MDRVVTIYTVGKSCWGLLWCNKFNFLPLGRFTIRKERKNIKLKSYAQRLAVNSQLFVFPQSRIASHLIEKPGKRAKLSSIWQALKATTWQLNCGWEVSGVCEHDGSREPWGLRVRRAIMKWERMIERNWKKKIRRSLDIVSTQFKTKWKLSPVIHVPP